MTEKVQTLKDVLQEILSKRNTSLWSYAKDTGKFAQAMYRKVYDGSFTVKQIKEMKKILNLTDEEILAIVNAPCEKEIISAYMDEDRPKETDSDNEGKK